MGRVRGFFEYKIAPDKREMYLQWAGEIKRVMRDAGLADFEVLESNHRPNQFLETFTAESMDRYEAIAEKLERQFEYRELRDRLDNLLQNGRESIKIWFFSEV